MQLDEARYAYLPVHVAVRGLGKIEVQLSGEKHKSSFTVKYFAPLSQFCYTEKARTFIFECIMCRVASGRCLKSSAVDDVSHALLNFLKARRKIIFM